MADFKVNDLITAAGEKLRNDFNFLVKSNPHYGERATETENILIQFLNNHLPKRYAASTGFIIDNENNLSKQLDVIVYDAINSPVFRKDEKVMILPSDNAAIAIEVKSNLTKLELKDAVEKIKIVKKLKKTPISKVDQQITFLEIAITKTMGVVFAYKSAISLEAISTNLAEFNTGLAFSEWIDLIVVLDQGIVTYYVKSPMGMNIFGKISCMEANVSWPLPYYITIAIVHSKERTINEFFAYVMHHLTFFRKRSSVDTSVITGVTSQPTKIMQGFQFDSNAVISKVDEDHLQGKFHFEKCYYFYEKEKNTYLGSLAYLKWKDGGVIFYTGKIPPAMIFAPYYNYCKVKNAKFLPGGGGGNDYCSIVLRITLADFEKVTTNQLAQQLGGIDISEECKIPGIPKNP